MSVGANDPRVPAWQSGKFAARLQRASTSGRPVLLRVSYDGGHWVGAKDDEVALIADQYAFLLAQFGVGGPQATH
jgi:prolyl oligopeptidase